jgi:PleD family two-component response regulator
MKKFPEYRRQIAVDFHCEDAHVMVIDDDASVTRVVCKILNVCGFSNTSYVNDPADALNQIRLVKPDLILLDILMPGMDGLAILKEIKSDEQLRDTIVVMLSAVSDKCTKYKTLNLGAIDFINKPVNQIELELRVRNALKVL